MVLPSNMDATWLNPSSVQYNAQELRRADAAMFNGDGQPFGVRGGIVAHGDNSLAVTVNGGDLVTIQPGAVVIPGNAGSGNGAYRAALGAAETGSLAVRNATNPRIDLLVFRVMDDDVVGTHDAYTGRIELIQGVAAGSPAVPALPSLAVELARITVPASGGGAATVDLSHRRYAMAPGGELLVPTAARLPSTATETSGANQRKWTRAVALDTGLEYRWDGTAWRRPVQGGTVVVPLTGSNYATGQVNFPTPYALPPSVQVTSKVGDVFATVTEVFANYITIGVYRPAGGVSFPITVEWLAVGGI